jgi:c-di-GMP-binding flagellar brake protein YcgR
MQTLRERRRHRRFLDEVRVRYRDIEGHEPSRWGLTRDLSLGGVCLLSERLLPLGCHLAIEVHIEHETAPILALARVVRSERDESGCTSGLEFLWVGEEDRGNLQRLTEYFLKKYGETGDYASQ